MKKVIPGIDYFNDINCRWKKTHKRGYKTIYYVGIVHSENGGDFIRVTMPYGNFNTAYVRYQYEMSHRNGDDGNNIIDVSIGAVTYKGVKPVFTEVMLRNKILSEKVSIQAKSYISF